MALEVAHIAAWEWHLSSGQMRWSTDPEVLFGFPRGSFGQELRIFRTVHRDDRSRVEAATAGALKTGSYEAEYRAVRPDGTVVWIKERGRVLSDIDGDRMVGISRDITAERESALERERLLKSERDARDEAERQSRLKDDFLATLSHELRTPMNIILGWLDTLASAKPVRDPAAVVRIVQRNAQVQAKLIEDLLDMSRLTSGNLRVERAPVDIESALHAAVLGLQPAADAKGVQVVPPVLPCRMAVMGDARRLQQVFWNLLHNAIKFTPARGRVEVRVEQEDGRVRIVVQDNGSGINREFLPYVFERFRQQDSSTTRESPGLGLGLSISKHLVELHGGTITAASEGEGRGATFVVELPPAMSSSIAAAPGPHTDRVSESEVGRAFQARRQNKP
jgi:signal transduction histidine kinase